MKYPITIALLLALCSCQNNSVEPYTTNSIQAASGDARAGSDEPLKGHVSRPGLYRLVRSAGVFDDSKTGTGKSVVKPVVELVRTTDRIPLIKGSQMYLQYRIWPLPAQPAYVDLRRVVKHPEMTLPDGSVSTGSDYMIKGRISAKQVIAYTGYGLDEDYELVEGDWIFEIWYQDKKVIEQKFTTYWPDKAELAKLEPLLVLGNRAVGQGESSEKAFSRFNWPRITVGGIKTPGPTAALNKASSNSD